MKTGKFHYSWVICAACTLLIVCNMGLCNTGFSVWLQFAENHEGFTGAQGSSILSVRCIFSLVCMVFVSRVYERIGVRLGAVLGTALSAAAYVFYSIGGSIYVYYVGAAVAGLGYGLGTTIAISILIKNWFHRRNGLAMGIATAGTGVCAMAFPPVMTSMVNHLGLPVSFLFVGGFVAVSALVVLLVVRETPDAMGMEPYCAGQADEGEKTKPRSYASRDLRAGEWVFAALALLMVGAVSTGGTGHFSIVMTTSGYTAEFAAGVVSFWGVILIVAKFIYGAAIDRFGCKRATVIFYSMYVVACAVTLLFYTGSRVLPYLFALIYGFGIPPATVGFPIWAGDLSTPARYAKTVKWFQMFFLLGGVIFTSVPGMLYDRLGNYQSAYIMFGIFTVLDTAIVAGLYRRFSR